MKRKLKADKPLDQIGFEAWNNHCKEKHGCWAHGFDWENAPAVYKECATVTADAIEKACRARIKSSRRVVYRPKYMNDFSAGFQRGLAQADRQWEKLVRNLKRNLNGA